MLRKLTQIETYTILGQIHLIIAVMEGLNKL
jgi:hypothetical protein